MVTRGGTKAAAGKPDRRGQIQGLETGKCGVGSQAPGGQSWRMVICHHTCAQRS